MLFTFVLVEPRPWSLGHNCLVMILGIGVNIVQVLLKILSTFAQCKQSTSLTMDLQNKLS